MTSTTAATFDKSISYDRETHDFCATLDGNYIGHFNSYHDAENALDQVAYDLLMDGQCATATALDAGSDVDAIAADTLVIRADAPAQLAAVVQADALLLEADAVLGKCEIAGCGSVATHHLRILDTPRVERVCCEHYPDITGESCACDAELAAVYCQHKGCTGGVTHIVPFGGTIRLLCCLHYGPCICSYNTPAPTCAGFVPGICANPADPATAPYCRQCAVGIDKTLVAAYVQKLMEDAGLACSYCGEPHTADACPLRKPLVAPAPKTCKNCGGQHSIQRCGEIWRALRLFA